jgi:DNA-binding NarL/FixJ family response regulator
VRLAVDPAQRAGRSREPLSRTSNAPAFEPSSRARRERLATGEIARKRTVETTGELTSQEVHVARLAGDGLSNPEIGARLFISARRVQYHPGKVFTKLAISSRSELDRVLPERRL